MAKKFDLSKLEKNTQDIQKAKQKMEMQEKDEYLEYSMLDLCEWNPEKIEEDKIEELKTSIMENGLIHNLLVFPKEDGRYRILSGNTRYVAIGRAIEEGCQKFVKGIRCHVTRSDLSETEQRILVEEANFKQRTYSQAQIREAMHRMVELQKQRVIEAKENGSDEKIRVKQEVAKAAEVSVRTVERYESINNSLIPQLQELFDQGKISVENAAKYAKYSEEIQNSFVELIEEGGKSGREKIEAIIKENKKNEEELKERISNLELEKEKQKTENQEMQSSLEAAKEKIKLIQREKEELEQGLSTEHTSSAEDEEVLADLTEQLEAARKLAEEYESRVDESNKEIEALKKQMENLKNEPAPILEVGEETVSAYKIEILFDEIVKKMNEYRKLVKHHETEYGELEKKELYEKKMKGLLE